MAATNVLYVVMIAAVVLSLLSIFAGIRRAAYSRDPRDGSLESNIACSTVLEMLKGGDRPSDRRKARHRLRYHEEPALGSEIVKRKRTISL